MFGDQTYDIGLIADAGRTVQCRRRREPEFADVFTAVVVDRRRRRKRIFFDPDHHVAAAVLRAGLENGAGLEAGQRIQLAHPVAKDGSAIDRSQLDVLQLALDPFRSVKRGTLERYRSDPDLCCRTDAGWG